MLQTLCDRMTSNNHDLIVNFGAEVHVRGSQFPIEEYGAVLTRTMFTESQSKIWEVRLDPVPSVKLFVRCALLIMSMHFDMSLSGGCLDGWWNAFRLLKEIQSDLGFTDADADRAKSAVLTDWDDYRVRKEQADAHAKWGCAVVAC